MRTAKSINWLIIHYEKNTRDFLGTPFTKNQAFKLSKNKEGICYPPDLSPVFGELMVVWLNEV